MIPLFFGFHLSFVADLLGLSLKSSCSIHGSSAVVSTLLGCLHVVFGAASSPHYRFHGGAQLFGLIGGVSLLVVVVTSPEPFRSPAYEAFLRAHQALAVLILYTIWRHVGVKSLLPSLYIYLMIGILACTSVSELCSVLFRNFAFGRPYPCAYITNVESAVRISLTSPRSLRIKAGQYLNLWIPSISFWSSHPFTIVSWTKKGEDLNMTLLIEPREGFTNQLLSKAVRQTRDPAAADHRLAFYSGPHGSLECFGNYGSVLLIASGFGIAAQLPHIQELIRGYNRCEVRTRRVHLVWLLQETGDEAIAEDMLDDLLHEDAELEGYIFRVSIHYASGDLESKPVFKGRHARVSLRLSTLNLHDILQAEIAGEHDQYVDGVIHHRSGREWGDMLVAVSASDHLRDDLRELVRRSTRVDQRIWFLEMDYQPSRKRGFWAFINRHTLKPKRASKMTPRV